MGAAHFAPDDRPAPAHPQYLLGVLAKALGGRAAEVGVRRARERHVGRGRRPRAGDERRAAHGRRLRHERGGRARERRRGRRERPASSSLQSQIDTAMRGLIREQAERAEALVREHHAAVEAVANALLERDVLDADDVITIARSHGVHTDQSPALAA
jgi:cell division protease FtsH